MSDGVQGDERLSRRFTVNSFRILVLFENLLGSGLDESALRVARGMKFQPAMRCGVAVPSEFGLDAFPARAHALNTVAQARWARLSRRATTALPVVREWSRARSSGALAVTSPPLCVRSDATALTLANARRLADSAWVAPRTNTVVELQPSYGDERPETADGDERPETSDGGL
jgi:hypothetical protein